MNNLLKICDFLIHLQSGFTVPCTEIQLTVITN